MRSVLHLGVVACLLASFTKAPFAHTHEGDSYHEHADGLIHTHGIDPAPDGPAWENSDYADTRWLDWLAGDGKSSIRQMTIVSETIVLPAPIEQPSPIAELIPHNHDPPALLNLKPRAPPV